MRFVRSLILGSAAAIGEEGQGCGYSGVNEGMRIYRKSIDVGNNWKDRSAMGRGNSKEWVNRIKKL